MKHKIKCSNTKCNHVWETSSKLVLVTCPSCNIKTKNHIEEEENENKITNTKTNRGNDWNIN